MTQDMNDKIMTRNIGNLTRGLSTCEVRLAVTLLLLMVVGVSGMKAQETPDYSGIYYIASDGNAAAVERDTNNKLVEETYTYSASSPESNYYLVPASDPVQTNEKDAYFDGTTRQKPFLTTYKVGQESNPNWSEAVWVIRQVTDDDGTFYYIMHAETGKYVIYDPSWTNTANLKRRKCMHLDSTSPSEDCKFKIEEFETGVFDIVPKTFRDLEGTYNSEHIFWNIADKNRNSRHGLDSGNYYGGLVGLYSKNNKGIDDNSRWKFEKVAPKVSSTATDKVELAFPVTAATTKIHYTTDGSNPIASSTEYTNATNLTLPAEGNMVVKAIAVVSDGVTPTPNTVSSVVATLLYKPDVTLSQSTYTYNGGENKPTVSAVSITTLEGTTTADASAYSAPTYSADVTNVGTPSVTITDADESDFWYIWNASTTFAINQKEVGLTWTPDPASFVYNGAGQSPTATATGLVGSDVCTVTVDVSANSGSSLTDGNAVNVGGYTATASALSNSNYKLPDDVTQVFSIIRRPVTVTADNDEKVYDGTALTKNTATASGLVEGHILASYTVTGSQTVAGTSNNVPSEAVIKKDETDVTANYSITYANGTLEVTPKALTITAKNHEITYGDEPVNDGVEYDGFIEGESETTEGMFTGTLAYAYDYSQYGDIGDYNITPSGLTATNYDITFVAGTLTVNKREVGIEWGDTCLGYNGSEQVPTATATNVVNNDEIIVTVTGAQTNVGTDYTATATGITGAKAGNYQFPSSNPTTTFSIGPGTFTPIVSIEGWTYGGASNAPSVSGNMSGGDVTYSYTVKGEDNYSTEVPTNAGDYTVKVTITATGNYESVEATTDFTIAPKIIGDGNKTVEGITIVLNADGTLYVVTDGEATLTENTDYTKETTEDGQDKLVIITGMGNYTGSAKGIYANPTFTDPDGEGAGQAAAVYKAKRDMAKPSGIKPYIVRKVNPTIGTLTISEIDYIPEGVPVLLLSDVESEGFTAAPKEEATTAITDGAKNSNLLKVAPTSGVKVEAAQIYTFYKGEFVLTKKGTLSEGKFYLYNPNYTATSSAGEGQQGGGNAPSLSTLRFVIEEEPTGITETSNENGEMRNDSAWYTLDGRKLNGKPTKAGLYIWNGRKTVIKRK
ncbi:MAG: chitobiase/beta-hexosaminidase C-terminal domain-containing protein [Prevotella sp.]|nr:chitobiase/beta-hexosaminidase C-terminal domain-containing protein [Prevotella sp.]